MESSMWDQNFVPQAMLCPSAFSQLSSENGQLESEPSWKQVLLEGEEEQLWELSLEWLFVVPLFPGYPCSGLSQVSRYICAKNNFPDFPLYRPLWP